MSKIVKMENGSETSISDMLGSIERYNPDHLPILQEYVQEQARENSYDLEANLAVLKLFQFNPHLLNLDITYTILLKCLTNLPHTDFVLAKYLLLPLQMQDETVKDIIILADILEKCDFELFWERADKTPERFKQISGFFDSIRKYVSHVVGITYQTIEKDLLKRLLGRVDDKTLDLWVKKNNWKVSGKTVSIATQDVTIKTKNITEKIEFDNLGQIMAQCL